MSAEELRAAARLMRERAKAARAGRWTTTGSGLVPETYLVVAQWENGPRRLATCAGSLPEGNLANAEHIASWHPAVALAVADWLEAVADRHDELLDTFAPGSRAGLVTARENVTAWEQALTVARTYLGAT